jgi:hypothetical protein
LEGHSTDTRALVTSLAVEPCATGLYCGSYKKTAAREELAQRFGIRVDIEVEAEGAPQW